MGRWSDGRLTITGCAILNGIKTLIKEYEISKAYESASYSLRESENPSNAESNLFSDFCIKHLQWSLVALPYTGVYQERSSLRCRFINGPKVFVHTSGKKRYPAEIADI